MEKLSFFILTLGLSHSSTMTLCICKTVWYRASLFSSQKKMTFCRVICKLCPKCYGQSAVETHVSTGLSAIMPFLWETHFFLWFKQRQSGISLSISLIISLGFFSLLDWAVKQRQGEIGERYTGQSQTQAAAFRDEYLLNLWFYL